MQTDHPKGFAWCLPCKVRLSKTRSLGMGLEFPMGRPNYDHGTLVLLWYGHWAFASYPFMLSESEEWPFEWVTAAGRTDRTFPAIIPKAKSQVLPTLYRVFQQTCCMQGDFAKNPLLFVSSDKLLKKAKISFFIGT